MNAMAIRHTPVPLLSTHIWPLDGNHHVGFEVLTAVVVTSTIFWDITPCSPFSVNRCFGRIYRLHLHGRKNLLATCFHAGFLLYLFCRPWRWSQYFPPKLRLILNGLHGVISQKIVLFGNHHVLHRTKFGLFQSLLAHFAWMNSRAVSINSSGD
jgi:hypothetical protein